MAPEPKKKKSLSVDDDDDDNSSVVSSDHESQSLSDSSKTNSTGPKAQSKTAEEHARDEKMRKEGRAVNRARLICLVVFFASAAAVSVAMYKFTRGNEQDNFELEVSRMNGVEFYSVLQFPSAD